MSEPPLTLKRASAILGVEPASSTEERQRVFDEKRTLLEQKVEQAPTPGLQAKYRHAIDTLTRAYETLEFAATERELERLRRASKSAKPPGPSSPGGASTSSGEGRRSPRDFIIAQAIIVLLALVLGGWRLQTSRRNAEVARVAAAAKAESDRIAAEARGVEQARKEEAERQEALARAAKIEAERRAAEDRVIAQRNETERLRNLERQTRVRLIELETHFEALEQALKDVDRAVNDQKSAERDLAQTQGWQLEWAQRRRSLLEGYRSWLEDFVARHPAKVRLKAALQLLQGNDIDGAAAEARAGSDEWTRHAAEPERRRYTDVGQVLIEWVIGPKEWPKEIFARVRLDEPAAVNRIVADLRNELAYLDDRAKKPIFTDWRGRLLPLGWLAGEVDRDFVRWRPRFVSRVLVTTIPVGAQVTDEHGEIKGTSPAPVDLMRGTSVRLTALLTGYTPATVTANVGFEGDQEVRIELSEITAPKEGHPFTVPDLGLSLVWIEAGMFTMGSPPGDKDSLPDESPPVKVSLTNGYWLGKYEVTQAEWSAVMRSNPSYFKKAGPSGDVLPVENISWREAMEFCRRLSEKERTAGRLPSGYEYTLPTEAQWEYACRAGTTTPFAGDPNALGWYDALKGGSTHPVGQKQPNAWGLHDMHGNVWEWCRDWYHPYPGSTATAPLTNPTGQTTGTYRINRGGSWNSPVSKCRSAFRNWLTPNDRGNGLGFRLALTRFR